MMRLVKGLCGAAVLAALVLPAAHAATVSAETAPTVSDSLMRQGLEALERKEFDSAKDLFEQAVVAYPRNARAYGYLGQAYEQSGNSETARKYYGISLTIDPDDIQALGWDGQAALAADDLEAARERRDRLQRVCNSRCAEYRDLNAALSAKETDQPPAQ